MTDFAELATTTNFSFLYGASHPEDCVARALELGHIGIGIADHNSVAGVVRAYAALKEQGISSDQFRLVVGSRLIFADGTPDILAYPKDRTAWGHLCQLLTLGRVHEKKGDCHLTFEDLEKFSDGLLLCPIAGRRPDDDLRACLERLKKIAPQRVRLALSLNRHGDDRRRLLAYVDFARSVGVPLLAINDALYHEPEQRALQDVLTCIREKTNLQDIGQRLESNAERYLKPADEMLHLFRDCPEAVAESARMVGQIQFSLSDLAYEYPDEPIPKGKTPQQHLIDLTWAGAAERFPDGVPPKIEAILKHELVLIEKLDYAPYFLTVHDIVAFARSQGILCQGRGSAANSSVCFVLGITGVDPTQIDLLFERFVSAERREPPDIDVDFEHERREEVIQYIYRRYGRHRAALCGTVITYRPRSAIRDVGKALGLSEDTTSALAGTVWGPWGSAIADAQIAEIGLDPTNPDLRRAIDLSTQLIGFPRHLSQHVGGFVLTRGPLNTIVPIGNGAMPERTFIEWDKDDIDTLGIMKVDVLALGMLSCIRRAFDLMAQHDDIHLTHATIPREDKNVYQMLSRGDSLGVFQVESRAQMNMLPRLKPACFYDLVIQVAIVRPGPIQGDMVHPYLRRRQAAEPIILPGPAPQHGPRDELQNVLGKTLGVPLFQEQAMRIAMVAACFSPEEANRLRRAMATFRKVGLIHLFQTKMIEGMVTRGYERDFAERCFRQIEGFGTYGFPESHAAAFAHLVYVSAWIKCHHPAVFAAALLNSQPMGFYAPAQIVRDAREHGVDVRAVDINHSAWDCTLERTEDGALALRLGLRQLEGFRHDWAQALFAKRGAGYCSPEHLMRQAQISKAALVKLADADAMRSIGLDRREAAWAVRRLPDDDALPLFAAANAAELAHESEPARLPDMQLSEHVVADYQTTFLSLKAHPMSFLRASLARAGLVTCQDVMNATDGKWLKTAGLVLVRQRPGSAKGVVFITIEDETGIANLVVWPKLVEQYRREVMGARLLEIQGRVQKSAEGIVHFVAQKLTDRSGDLSRLSQEENLSARLSRADEIQTPVYRGESPAPKSHPRDMRVLPKSRDFH